MPLRFGGNQSLQTAPSPMLAGASTVSLSVWLQVNPGCNVTRPGGAKVFGDGGGRLSVYLSGTGTVRVAWIQGSVGTPGGGSGFSQTIAAGVGHHLAVIWEDGLQRYFLDGRLVKADRMAGPLGVPGGTPAPFRLGSDADGADVTFDEPTLWLGYALGETDVLNLRDRAVGPGSIAPASIALRWSLAGKDGVSAAIGDPGLADQSASGLNLAAVTGSAPAYSGGGLVYDPPARIGSIKVAPSGQAIVVDFRDRSGGPTEVSSLLPSDEVQTLNVAGTPVGDHFTLSRGGQTTAPIALTRRSPSVSATWQFSGLTPGVPHFLRAQFLPFNSLSCSAAVFDVFDDATGAKLLSATIDLTGQTDNSAMQDFTTGPPSAANAAVGGYADFYTLSTGSAIPTGSSVTIRMTGAAPPADQRGDITLRNINLSPHGKNSLSRDPAPGPIGIYSDPNDQASFYQPMSAATLTGPWNTTYLIATPTGTSDFYEVSAAAIQSVLEGLPGNAFPAGSVVVSGPPAGPLTVRYTGPLGADPQPLLGTSDPAIVVTRANGGGRYPSIRVNGGSPISLRYPIWGAGRPDPSGTRTTVPYLSAIIYPLPQSAPASHHYPATIGDSNFHRAGPGWDYTLPAGAYDSQPTRAFASADPSATADWSLQGLPAGTYRLSATHPASASNTAAARFDVADGTGRSLGSATINQSATATGPAEGTSRWSPIASFTLAGLANTIAVRLSNAGTASTVLVADCLRLERTSADASLEISPSDTVTFSAVAGFATTVAGDVPTTIDAPAANLAGGTLLPPFPPGPKTMKVGYNFEGVNYYLPGQIFSNFAKRIEPSQLTDAILDADGYPVKIPRSVMSIPVVVGYEDSGGSGRGVNTAPGGRWTVVWDGTAMAAGGDRPQITLSGGNVATEVSRKLTGGVDNRLVYEIRDDFFFSPEIYVQFWGISDNGDGTYRTDVKNLRIYPPDPADPTGNIAWASPPKWYPPFLAQLGTPACLRMMDPLTASDSNIHDFSEVMRPSRMGFSGPVKKVIVPITEVRKYPGTDRYFSRNNRFVIQLTTAVPHGFLTGMKVQIGTVGTIQTDLGPLDLNGNVSCARVTSPTTFLLALFLPGDGDVHSMTNILTPSGPLATATVDIGGGSYAGGMAFEDAVELCNFVGADMWFSLYALANDACVASMAGYIAANLRPDLSVHVELGNECWNYGFSQSVHCIGMARTVLNSAGDYDSYSWYIYRSAQVHRIFRGAFAAAGLPVGRVRRILGIQSGEVVPTVLQLVAGDTIPTTGSRSDVYNAVLPIEFDEFAQAFYYSNDSIAQSEPSLAPTLDVLTTGQLLDCFEVYSQRGGYSRYLGATTKALAAAPPPFPVDVVAYEMAPERTLPNASAASANHATRTQAVARHPRMFGIHLNVLQQAQDAKFKLINHYYLNGGNQLRTAWNAYLGHSMADGTGDPAADRANVDDPTNIPRVRSEVGGALKRWISLVKPRTPRRIIPGRAAKPRARGYRAW